MADNKDKILDLIRQKGPCLPSDIYKELNTDQMFASAMLGELVSNGFLEVSNLKRASSPYYYLKNQREKLQDFAHFLNDKEKMAFNLIKEKQILQDSKQSPLIRVALRAIKDYAIPIQIKNKDETILFWKWYLSSQKDVEEKIKKILGISEPKKEAHPQIQKHQQFPQKTIVQPPAQKQTIQKHTEKEHQRTIRQEPIKDIQKKEKTTPKKTHLTPPTKKTISSSNFLEKIISHFKKNNITIINQETKNRMKTEIDFIIELPSAVGVLQYYCKAKSKKKINDSDMASAFVQGQQKKLPVIFLITGEMTKKSEAMLDKEFKGLKIHKI